MEIIGTYTVEATYGSGKTPCEVFVAEDDSGNYWYCVDGGRVVNCTTTELTEGVDIEELQDIDCFTWSSPIATERELAEACEE
ncbi:hypothetical protein [Endozoicomonas ascidiicola]|uniref:hypothetical protein n=1 Tax=Endozoicomonas ascidiicola TaxID=1698521 RepID=UPI00082ED8CF|nr:hypothetical protein [Endozoicomonas ascidiicola]